MRRWVLSAALGLLALGCAHVEAPTGGPPDNFPPFLERVEPDSLSVNPGWSRPVELSFSERISEEGVEDAVLVSPRTSGVRVEHSRTGLHVSLRRGWQPGTIYHVIVRPTIADLFNNRLDRPIKVVFSTGPAIPATRAEGTVVDRITLDPDTAARIEAIRRTDSLVYVTIADTAGHFTLAHVPPGDYQFRAYRDVNRNRELDPFEARDSASAMVTVGESPEVRLSVVEPDSTPPVAQSARAVDSATVTVEFDDYIDPGQPPPPDSVRITGPDSVALPIDTVRVGEPRRRAARDTSTAQPPMPPSQTLTIELADSVVLAPGTTYGVSVAGARNVHGLDGGGRVELTTPAPPPPAPPDTISPDTAETDTTAADAAVN